MLKKKVKIGFIGTGIIGLPMAKNLSKNHYDVSAYSRNAKYHTNIIKNGINVIRNHFKTRAYIKRSRTI